CRHETLLTTPSDYAKQATYIRPSVEKRLAATTLHGRKPTGKPNNVLGSDSTLEISPTTFPAPLVLPGDDLALDPRCPPQSVRAWSRLKERNDVTEDRRTLYVVAPPDIDDDIKEVSSWCQIQRTSSGDDIELPRAEDVIDYLSAFYHGIPVKRLPFKVRFVAWDTTSPKKYIGLDIGGGECVRIRTRRLPSRDGSTQPFARQLNLDDLLDAAIGMLPDAAYALLLLVTHDLYEDADDEFVCGRAYGGSRVAVVSSARYHPALDVESGLASARAHAWPASHCAEYVRACCDAEVQPRPRKRAHTTTTEAAGSLAHAAGALHAAVAAHRTISSLDVPHASSAALTGLWLGRVCRTASHELGHCFGLDHCVYYACVMQGSASLIEDARQPPYLCPVDLTKVLRVLSTTAESRYSALLAFCERHADIHLFAALAAWLR
ncbi:hypothetical protein FISHEDRAFT_15312, partial [Fistulina hepatica ATCC 64428]